MEDGSLRERYLHNTCSQANTIEGANVFGQSRAIPLILGEGLSTVYFEQCLPVNGISFLFKSFGFAGLVFLFAGAAIALRGMPGKAKLYAALTVGFGFTSYPLVTYVIFWLWVPALFGLMRFKEFEQTQPAEPVPPEINP
jgi:hypothetical protein